MPRYAMPNQARMRKAAIGKKMTMETDLIQESEVWVQPSKQTEVPDSPITVASTFNYEKMPEITPLPGAWIEVGKGGRPVKSTMYDPPKPAKKKRIRARKKAAVEDDPVSALAEEPSSSKCIGMFERATETRQKLMTKSKNTKYWEHYHQEKQLKMHARDSLIAALADSDMLVEEGFVGPLEKIVAPKLLKLRDNKHKDRVATLRRQARLAAAGARCYTMELEEDGLHADPPIISGRSAQKKRPAASEENRGYPLGKVPRSRDKASASTKRKENATREMREAISTQSEAASNGWMSPSKRGRAKGRAKGCNVM